jgi:hypothetical protein
MKMVSFSLMIVCSSNIIYASIGGMTRLGDDSQ